MEYKISYDLFDMFNIIPFGATVALYGAGKRGKMLFRFLNKHRKDVCVKCYIDTFKGDNMSFPPVVRVHELLQHCDINVVIICSTYTKQIASTLNAMGVHNYIDFDLACARNIRVKFVEVLKRQPCGRR